MSSAIPKEWIGGKLEEFAILSKGLTYASCDYSDEQNGIPFLTLKSIAKDGGYSPNGLKFFKGHFKEHHILHLGDILFANTDLTRNGDVVGSPLFFDESVYIGKTLYSMDLSKLEVDPFITDPKFLYFLLLTHRVKRWMVSSSAGSTVLHLDTKRVMELYLNFPPLPEQKKIASILTSVDKVVENTKKKIDKLKDLKRATMNELLTKGIGHTEFKNSKLGLIPKSWKLATLSSLAEYKNGRAFKPSDWSNSGLPILRIAQINNPDKVEDFYSGNDVEDKHFITKGDLVFSWSATLKAEIWQHYDAVLNQHIFKVTEKNGTSKLFLQQLLDYSIPKLSLNSHGSTMKHIKKGVLDEFFIPLPPLPEQKKIASILASQDSRINSLKLKLQKTKNLKKSLMQDLLTGKVRVAVN